MHHTLRPTIARLALAALGTLWLSAPATSSASELAPSKGTSDAVPFADLLAEHCFECHQGEEAAGEVDLSELTWQLQNGEARERWEKVYDVIAAGKMPPAEADRLGDQQRAKLAGLLEAELDQADYQDVLQSGRVPIRRLNRGEYQQNLRDLLHLPHLDISDLLPEDRESLHFNKSAETLDMTRVQLAAYVDAAAIALREAVAKGTQPRAVKTYHALATNMFPKAIDHAGRESSFFAKNSRMVPLTSADLAKIRRDNSHDPEMEIAIFRSASWPYYGYPEDFVAEEAGVYRVRFSARAVRQLRDFRLVPAVAPLAMTFRARKRSQADVSGDVRAVGGLMDIQPHSSIYETEVLLKEQETIEYSLMGLPVPFLITSHGGPLYYDFPPMPDGGHRGIAYRWLEITGPVDMAAESDWPPQSHRVLFDNLPIRDVRVGRLSIEVVVDQPRLVADRLLTRFARRAARRPIEASSLAAYRQLIYDRLDEDSSFAEAMLLGYQAFLCSSHFLYLHDPAQPEPNLDSKGLSPESAIDQHHLAARLSHFLWNTRPDGDLQSAARRGELTDRTLLQAQSQRLLDSPKFEDFIRNFTDYWLDLKHINRDSPDIRLYPEYRFDDYLIESMERETRAFVLTVIRENLPVSTLVDADFALVNDKLAAHYELPPVMGSGLRRIELPPSSPYGGLITQAAIMKVTANGTTTSPVTRGAWIMDRIMGDPPPPPPETVPAIEPDLRGATTIRQQIAQHAQATECAGCHARFDPVGFALESFDVMGGWRERYRSLEKGDEVTGIDRAGHAFSYRVANPIDAHGQLLGGQSFDDIIDLKQLLAAKPRELAANLLRQWTVYATGAPLRFSDRREIEQILDQCAADEYLVQDLLHAFICSRIFTGERRTEILTPSSSHTSGRR